ncbi:hypothetical protein ACHAPU_003120 [Fusarium lateritium]
MTREDVGSQRGYNDRSVPALESLFKHIAQPKEGHLCVSIGGLDEICNADGIDKLTELIDEFLELPDIKICASSRPGKMVLTWFKQNSTSSILL